jgi:hypothetical protein
MDSDPDRDRDRTRASDSVEDPREMLSGGRVGAVTRVVLVVLVVGGILVGVAYLAGGVTGGGGGDAGDRPNAHGVGEPFVVGEQAQEVRYRVTDVRTAQRLDGSSGPAADGEFVVVTVEIVNTANTTVGISPELYQIIDGQGRGYGVDTASMTAVENPVAFEPRMQPGERRTGVLVFDVPPDRRNRQLEVRPTGIISIDPWHYVRLSSAR